MGSTFYGFEIAKTGLFYNQRALDVTAHNIANADTKGYSRQRIISSSIDPQAAASIVAELSKGAVGAGVRIQSVEQIRNLFLDRQFRNENSLQGEFQIKADVLGYIEKIFNEPSETGISNALNEFFKGIQELSKNAGSKDIRTNLLQQAINLTETIRHYDRQLVQTQQEQDYAITVSINKVNDIIRNITALNDRIAKYELGGQVANDLRDQRNLFLDELSEFANITYSEAVVNNQSLLTVKIKVTDASGNPGEITLIDNNKANFLIAHKETLSDGSEAPYHSVYIESDSADAIDIGGKTAVKIDNFTSGKLKGYLDVRDGADSNNKGIQYFINQLDKLAEKLVSEINEIHENGWTYPDPNIPGDESVQGIPFFTGTKASDIRVADEIMNNVFNIAASGKKIVGSLDTGNNETLLDLLELRESKSIEGVYNFEDFMRGYVTELGVSTSYASNMVNNQEFLLNNIENHRQSISGVSLDEEMANMVKYEKAYQASARMITAMDEMLDIIINKLGIVGR